MSAIFLSASIPIAGRGDFYKTASPFLIQCAVQEFLVCALGRRLIVWGGHPAITPMVWAACESLGVSYAKAVVLYQSHFFADSYPEENALFKNTVETPAVDGDRQKSLEAMRRAMLSREDLTAAVFVGGMEGIFEEHSTFRKFHPNASVLIVPAAGGAARDLARERGEWNEQTAEDLNFARLFHRGLGIRANEPRALVLTARREIQVSSSGASMRGQVRLPRPKAKSGIKKVKNRSQAMAIELKGTRQPNTTRPPKKRRAVKRKK